MNPLSVFPAVAESMRRDLSGAPIRILLVEDEPIQRALVAGTLIGHGYAVETADSAARALGLLRDGFDLLITDIDLGDGMSGLNFVELARYERPDLPVIVASARAPSRFQNLSLDRALYLRKPYTRGVLLEFVEQLMGEDY